MRRVYIGKFSHHVRERDIERFFRSEGRIREVLMKDGFAFVEFEHTSDAETAVKRLDGRDLSGERVHVEFAKGPPRTSRDGMRGGGSMLGVNRRTSGRDGPPRRDFRNDRGGRERNDRGDRSDRDRGDTRGGGGSGGISYAEKYGPPRNTDFRVIVENLSSRVSWQDLKDLMRQAGEVTFADAHKRERNMGIVDFATVKDMRHAIETLNDTEFHGRRIKIYEDKGRRREVGGSSAGRRDVGGRRGGGRSRSRSPRRYSNSRSRSRDRAPRSRSRTRSPIGRDRGAISRSRSNSGSPMTRRKPQRSVSRSRSRSRSRTRSPTRSPTEARSRTDSVDHKRSPPRSAKRPRSRSNSAEDERSSRSPKRLPSRSRSRSASSQHSSSKDSGGTKTPPETTHSAGATNNNNNIDDDSSNKLAGGDHTSDSNNSHRRSVSRTPSPSLKKARLSVSPDAEGESSSAL